MNKNIHTFLGCDNSYEESRIVLFGAPFDATTSYRPGTRFASQAMRLLPYELETYSPYLDKDLADYNFFDAGDLEFSFGNVMQTLSQIKDLAQKLVKDDKIPVMIGGEHLLTLPVVEAVAEKYPDLHIIHFDAHTDLRDTFYGEKYSHATVLRRCHDILGDDRIYQFGIRSGEKAEFEWAKTHVNMIRYNINHLEEAIEKIKDKPVYITIDLDILDPSIFPGTGTPEPGGIDFNQMIHALKLFTRLNNVVGADVMELSPMLDSTNVSTIVAGKVLRELLLGMVK